MTPDAEQLADEIAALSERLASAGADTLRALVQLGEVEVEYAALAARLRAHRVEHGAAPTLATFEDLTGVPRTFGRFGRLHAQERLG